MNKITPEKIEHLNENEIFVFGSNNLANHKGGAAAFAVSKFGAENGHNELNNNSYGLTTCEVYEYIGNEGSFTTQRISVKDLKMNVDKFIDCAKKTLNLNYYVTEIGCGIAGWTIEEVAPLFKECMKMDNVALPTRFIDILIDEINIKGY